PLQNGGLVPNAQLREGIFGVELYARMVALLLKRHHGLSDEVHLRLLVGQYPVANHRVEAGVASGRRVVLGRTGGARRRPQSGGRHTQPSVQGVGAEADPAAKEEFGRNVAVPPDRKQALPTAARKRLRQQTVPACADKALRDQAVPARAGHHLR
ncbi:unnamed protein product, partial [Ixodes pacificus]